MMSDIPAGIEQFKTQEEHLDVARKKSQYSIGIPYKISDYRVPLTPNAVKTLTDRGHQITVQSNAGNKAGYTDLNYSDAGAKIVSGTEAVFESQIIIQTTPLDEKDLVYYRPDHLLISPLYLPSLSKEFLVEVQKKQITAAAMEYMRDATGSFPIVRMMSELAGASCMQTAAQYLSLEKGGKGVILGGITGIPPSKVIILGAGMVGTYAAKAAIALGAEVRVFDSSIEKLMRLQQEIGTKLYTSVIDPALVAKEIVDADVLIGAHHSTSGKSKILVSEDMVISMKDGSVIVDLSIDQGGCVETSHMTTLEDPVFVKHGVIHYCVPNTTASYAHTASQAISQVLLPMLSEATDSNSLESLLYENPGFRNGVYLYKGRVTNQYLSEKFGLKYSNLDLLLTWRS